MILLLLFRSMLILILCDGYVCGLFYYRYYYLYGFEDD
jgi:hypothetical protein